MIIEKEVSVIVMLTDLQEGARVKSDQYWPDREDETRDIGSGISLKHVTSEYQGVFLTRKGPFTFISSFLNLIVRTIKLMKDGEEVRQVTQLQTKKWADLTAPEDTKIMLDMV